MTLISTRATRPANAEPSGSPDRRGPISWSTQLGIGLAVGLGLGISARGFMRLLSDDPEFSWSGTLFIVGVFTVFGFVQSLVALVRSRTERKILTVPARTLGGVSYLLLGGGAGIIMVPFLWCAGLALWRTGWRPWIRELLGGIAALNVLALIAVQVTDVGFRPVYAIGFLVLIAVYLGTAWTVGPTLRPPAGRP